MCICFPGGSEGKASACDVEDPCSISGLGRSPGEGNGNSLQYSCLENLMDRGAWWATVHGVAKSQTRLTDYTHICVYILYIYSIYIYTYIYIRIHIAVATFLKNLSMLTCNLMLLVGESRK